MEIRTVLRGEARALWSDGRGRPLVAIAVGWGLLIGSRMIYPVVIPHLRGSFGMSLPVAGLLVSVLWFCGSVGQLPGGVLADRYDERSLLIGSVFVVATALAVVVVAPTTAVLFAATALWGLGHSLYPVSRITFLSTAYADRLGSALGVTMATGDVGQTMLPPIAAVLAAALVWQAGIGFVIPLLVVAGLLLVTTLPSGTSAGRTADGGPLRSVLDVVEAMRNPAIGTMTVVLFLYLFIWQSFTAFYPTYLMDVKGLSSAVASVLFGFFFAVGVVVKPVAGLAYDRFGMRRSLVGVLAPAVVGFALLPAGTNAWSLGGVTALVSVMLGTGAITQSYLAEAFSKELQGTGLGVIRTITLALGAAGPVVFGVVGERGYFDEGYLALAAIMAVVVLLVARMPRA